MTSKDIDKTIDNLCCQLKPVKRFCPYWRTGLWLTIAITYTVAMVLMIGVRPHFLEKVVERDFIFEIGLALATGMTAAMMTFWLTLPDSSRFEKFLAVPATLFFVHVFWMLDRFITEGTGLIPTGAIGNCWMDTALYAGIPAMLVVFMIRSGASVRPFWLAFNALLAVSAFAWIGIRFCCPHDTVGKAYFVNFLPFLVLGLGVGLFAKRLFRW